MRRFEIGKIYTMRDLFDEGRIWSYQVVSRTEGSITITDGNEERICPISKHYSVLNKRETAFPLGYYDLCPTLIA